nr:AAA domain-containing protein [Acidobacteriota bacterium]NIQ86291.1 AAA domain-containing protein [Acidobacteriota bacterium]
MRPREIDEYLKRDVIGQSEVLRFVSVAIFKHLQGERFGNLMMIGNSGTGKTTIMRSMERLYSEHQEFQKYRVVIIMNANTFATDEGVIDTRALFENLEERARRILGPKATPEEIALHMEHATVCLDEIDKVSGVVGGKPY